MRAAPFVLAGLVAVAVVVSSVAAVTAYYGFELRRAEGLRYRRGLLQEYSGTIPLDKVQSVADENVIARRLGYAAVEVETAGYAPGAGDGSGSQSTVPLADRERALARAPEVEPFGEVEFERPPKRARTRYVVRYALVVAFDPPRLPRRPSASPASPPVPPYSPLALLVVVPVAAHLKWATSATRSAGTTSSPARGSGPGAPASS
ncbi:PH domain-containing protein, partial [Halosegnis marinus]|uniref:PH domain-containing protein n=1 Tax=Halosegnis marinus TaxID=3034023 RepID=UPI00361B5BF6